MHRPDFPDAPKRFELKSLEFTREIFDALGARDDARILAAARYAPSQTQFFDHLRDSVGSITHRGFASDGGRRPVEYFCSLVLVPVLLPATVAGLVNNERALAPAIRQIRNWLQAWFEHKVEVTMFSAPISYAEICTWTPSVMREKVEHLGVQREPTIALPPPFEFNLPESTPTLAFFVAAVQRPFEWPTLPPENAGGDLDLQARIAGSLEVCLQRSGTEHPGDACVRVLAPDFSSEAIASGLHAWLTAINQQQGIVGWDVQQQSQDVAVVQLEVGHEAESTSNIPVRAYQLGLEGMEGLLARVSRLGARYLALKQ